MDAGGSKHGCLEGLWGCPVFDRDEERIGRLEAVFYDAREVKPEWLAIGVGLLGLRVVIVPAAGAVAHSVSVTVPFSSDSVKRAPQLRRDELDTPTLQDARRYYARVSGTSP